MAVLTDVCRIRTELSHLVAHVLSTARHALGHSAGCRKAPFTYLSRCVRDVLIGSLSMEAPSLSLSLRRRYITHSSCRRVLPSLFSQGVLAGLVLVVLYPWSSFSFPCRSVNWLVVQAGRTIPGFCRSVAVVRCTTLAGLAIIFCLLPGTGPGSTSSANSSATTWISIIAFD
ncbi:hypothetical protein BKA93DRAFT_152882 [Sparassis latifolia]